MRPSADQNQHTSRLPDIQSLVGQFCRKPDGQKVFIEGVHPGDGDSAPWAVGHYIEGPKKGTRTRCFVSLLRPLGYEMARRVADELF